VRQYRLFILLVLLSFPVAAQERAVVYGRVTDVSGKPLDLVSVRIREHSSGARTDAAGYYELNIPSGKEVVILYTFVGCHRDSIVIELAPGERRLKNIVMRPLTTDIAPVYVSGSDERGGITRIDPKNAGIIPSVSGSGIEELVKKMSLGVYSSNELSSQYSVRGGNFDENMVYVNDVEIYRPFLTRSGQQEGLSFVNSDLVSGIAFSSGGFDAKYGDKMSSVLDIMYKKPQKAGGSVSLSLLGLAAHVEGASDNERFTFLFGVRQKSNQYLLNALETKGQYKPSFTDVQLYTTWQVNEKTDVSFLGNYARNKYLVIPESRETQFGTVKESYQLKIYFDGQEIDKIRTWLGASTLTYKPRSNLVLKITASAFTTDENESYDIQGQYWIGRLEADLGKEGFGEISEVLGVGTDFRHARNQLQADVYQAEHRGSWLSGKNYVQWGMKYQHESVHDKLREWQMIDSSGYTVPRPSDSVGYTNPALQPDAPLEMQEFIRTDIELISHRYTAFLQNTWNLDRDSSRLTLTAGVRAHYWSVNGQLLVSPRATLSYKPRWEKDIVMRLSAGYYYQPPFYKELRDFSGNINKDLKAQTSIHFVLGADWNFTAWDRPFKFVSEVYYKYLNNLIPYEIDNVRLRYFAVNNARGYTTGLDMKINGEFVRDVESWFGLSLMQTREDILDDYYYDYYNADGEPVIKGYTRGQLITDSIRRDPGYVPRPTDQLLNVNLFFQDYLPKNPTYKMHLNFVYASPLPFGPPDHDRYKDTLRIPAYFRVDIGFSKQIVGEHSIFSEKNPLRFFKSLWVSAEVFNLLGRLNTISYLWIKDVNNRMYAVPNELTRRLINVKLIARF
jgi:hypothetical protein